MKPRQQVNDVALLNLATAIKKAPSFPSSTAQMNDVKKAYVKVVAWNSADGGDLNIEAGVQTTLEEAMVRGMRHSQPSRR